ncbi:uncharacterized protein LOC105797664 [Gossypium raimondii]|uniref:uncharacterized protein LOC105797664 n=1 Tax=Gossypium raimondii TaxID=29730 RepID=UPI00063AD3E2|nr:uncharacterized protein LOC105797664 [Gossypium raimondii]
MARWQIILSEFDIVYVNQKDIKGSAVVDFLASSALEDYEPMNFDFSNEDLMYVATAEEDSQENHPWRLNFDGASNAVGNGLGQSLYPLMEIIILLPLKGEWETRDPKLICYRRLALELIEEFDSITFCYLPREENHMADALDTLASMIQVNKLEDMKPIQISIYETSAHCYSIEVEENDNYHWYQDILRYVNNREDPDQATENDKRTLMRLTIDYVLDGKILYKRGKDQLLLRCVNAMEANKILEEVYEGIGGTHANGFMIARQIMRFEYYWATMEGDCINYAKKCYKCQIYGDKMHAHPSPLHVNCGSL